MSARDGSTSSGGLISRLLGRGGPVATAMDTFRRLALQLDQDLQTPGRGRVVLLVSPDQEGVAEIACEHLAGVLATEMARRVLIIAAEPTAEGAAGGPGLADVLREGPTAMDRVVTRDAGGMRAKLGKGSGLSPALLLGSAHRKAVIEAAAGAYDFVLVHAAPVLRDSTGLALGPVSDCVLLLALEGRTQLEHLDAARKLVASRTPAKLGVLLVSPPKSGRGLL